MMSSSQERECFHGDDHSDELSVPMEIVRRLPRSSKGAFNWFYFHNSLIYSIRK